MSQTERFAKSDIGRVGVDDTGMRFMVLQPTVHDRWDEEDGVPNVAVLHGSRRGLPGTVLHYSWVDFPVRWETDPL